jgi:hypothetical protein
MRKLYCTVAIPKFTYVAADVWFTIIPRQEGKKKTTGWVGAACKLTSVQRIATIAIMGAIRMTGTDILEAHANVMPIELLILNISY